MSHLTLVTGAGGFIGGQLVRDLSAQGVSVRAVDKKPIDDCAPISLRRRDEVLPEHEPPLEDWHRNGLSLPLAEALPIIGPTRINAGAKSFPQF